MKKAELIPALRAWLYLSGAASPLPEALPQSLGWLRRRWEAGDDHLPLGLVHDLGLLLLSGREFRFASARDLAAWPAEERDGRLQYEDRVLGRWALDPTVIEAHITLAGLPPEERDAAVAHAIGLALAQPLRATESALRGNPAHLRAVIPEMLASAPASFGEWSALIEAARVESAEDELALAGAALAAGTGRLFDATDLWEIAHFSELPSESARLALREVHAAAARIGGVTTRLALDLGRRAREVPVDRDTADIYPTGGFDAVSTRGTFENLVRTEVAYVGAGAAETGGVDLFDVRFAEGELLYYTRDESPLLEARRSVTLVIDRPAELRHKVPALAAQTLVLVEGICLVLQSDLQTVYGQAGSQVRLVWRIAGEEDRVVAEEEQTLLTLALAAEIAHRRVELAVHATWDDVPPAGRIVFSSSPRDARLAHRRWVRIGEERWQVDDEPLDATTLRLVADLLLEGI